MKIATMRFIGLDAPTAVVRIALALLAGAVLLGGCGGGADDQQQIQDVLVQGYTTDKPAQECEEALSDSLLKRTYGSAARCRTVEKEPDEGKPDAVEVSNVEVDGDTATAFVALKGGEQDGARGALELGRQGDDWRIEEFSPALLRSTFGASLTASRDVDAATRSCLTKRLRALSDDELIAFAYASMGERPEGLKRLQAMLARCASLSSGGRANQGGTSGGGTSFLRKKFEEGVVESLQGSGAGKEVIACVKRELRSRITDAQIVDLIGKTDKVPREVTQAAAGALAACSTAN
jgi:hypothetical protein